MSTEQNSLIVQLARQCSQRSCELFEHLGADLDRKMGALLGVKPDLDASLPPQQQQLASRADDADRPPVVSSSVEPKSESLGLEGECP
jgi:hypothetical protein